MEKIKRKDGFVYREMIYINGKMVKSPCFHRKTDAKKWKTEQESKKNKAKIFGYQSIDIERTKFSDFAEKWLAMSKLRNSQSTYSNYCSNLRKHIFPIVGNLYLDQITKDHADEIVKLLFTTKHNVSGINKIMRVFKSVLIEAYKQDFLIRNPLANYRKLKEKQTAYKFWNQSEINQFLVGNKNDALYSFYVVALNTGMRRGELAGLCFDKIDFHRSLIEVSRTRDRYGLRNNTKTNEIRYVPMNDVVKATLLNLFKSRQDGLVFVLENGQPIEVHHIYRDFKNAQKAANLSNIIRFHDLRHTFASHFIMSGGDRYELQKILGHTKFEMTQRYAHLSPDHLAKATKVISFGDFSRYYPESNHKDNFDNVMLM